MRVKSMSFSSRDLRMTVRIKYVAYSTEGARYHSYHNKIIALMKELYNTKHYIQLPLQGLTAKTILINSAKI
jgi:hypothetical protein